MTIPDHLAHLDRDDAQRVLAASAARAEGTYPFGWGAWLRPAAPDDEGWSGLVDDELGNFNDARDCFWHGRLGMPADHDFVPDEDMLERIRATLRIAERRPLGRLERIADVCDCSEMADRLLAALLLSSGLVSNGSDEDPPLAGLIQRASVEGLAVLDMLVGTGELGRRTDASPTMVEAIDGLLTDEADDPQRRMAELEAATAGWQDGFVRATADGLACVALAVRSASGGSRHAWMRAFPDAAARDAAYDWLCTRVDRWHDWARTALADPSVFDLRLDRIIEASMGH